MSQKLIIISIVILVTIAGAVGYFVLIQKPEVSDDLRLSLSFSDLRAGDSILSTCLRIELQNVSEYVSERPIVVNKRMAYIGPELFLIIKDENGESMKWLPPEPPSPLTVEDFAVLQPNESITKEICDWARGLFAPLSPGKYTLQAKYSNTEEAADYGLLIKPPNPTWKGELFSNIIEFSISESDIDTTSAVIPPDAFSYDNHNLIVASQNGIVNLAYNSSTQTYEQQAEIILSGVTGIVSIDNYIFAITEDEILNLNNKLEKLNSKKFTSIGRGAIATDKKNIFISADNSFIALDKNLKELSRVRLEYNKWPEKNAHNILIYNNTAYLLDNIVWPLFIFRVNVENPKNIQITEKIEFAGINAHLDRQWLNPELNQWLVLQSYGHSGGIGQNVYIYPMDKGTERIASQKIFSHLRIEEAKKQGFQINGITPLPPIWAVIQDPPSVWTTTQDEDGKYYLAQVKSENNKVSFSNLFNLEKIGSYRGDVASVIVRRKGDYLFIAPITGNLLQIINIKQKPKVIFSDQLTESEYNIRAIIDILPY